MPALQRSSTSPRPLVLVTGTTGYIGAWVARYLLEHGYDVRGTVRSTSKGQGLLEIFQKLPGYSRSMGKFHFVIVEDIVTEGAFDEAVKGVDGVEHVASPFTFNVDDPREIIEPAIRGTVGILKSVEKFGDKVKRVVITSSTVAISSDGRDDTPFDESDWNEKDIEIVKELGRNAPGFTKYAASKTLVEKAAWDWVSGKPSIPWDIVTLNPALVFGPTTNYVPSPENLNKSATDWYKTLMTKDARGRSPQWLEAKRSTWVDVRDVAEAHVRALIKGEAGGKRIILSAEPFSWQEWLDVANSLSPPPYTKHPLAHGHPGTGREEPWCTYITERAKQILGMSNDEGVEWRYRTKEETARDTLAEFAAKGW
ncbi:D-lactaldehyde dehydrogenase [Marasmius fiardii PR-910]|nr:D-lactaldehyde dehydrogenase [Marasmius fiardii PR-910]